MLGGMVPVSLPFQFPPLLNMPLGGGGSGSAATSSAAASNTAFSGLAQSKWRTRSRNLCEDDGGDGGDVDDDERQSKANSFF